LFIQKTGKDRLSSQGLAELERLRFCEEVREGMSIWRNTRRAEQRYCGTGLVVELNTTAYSSKVSLERKIHIQKGVLV
jgi:hypothetical protein